MSCRTATRCLLIFSIVAVVAAIVVLPQTASATDNCLQNEFKAAGFTQKLNCTANDVRIAEAVNPRAPDGTAISTCFAGTTFSFIADFQVVTTATARENIGLYMATGGQGQALTGQCVDNIISPLHDPGQATQVSCVQGGTGTQCLGSALYHEFDPSPDNCGDTTSADGTNQFVTIAVNNIVCPAVGTTFVLPNCTSWQQPGGTIQCVSDPSTGWPFNPAAVPGSPSKCNCGQVSIPITPISYQMKVSKTPTPSSQVEPGGDFAYDVAVQNTTTTTGPFGSEIINQVCDNKYGNIGTTGACSGGSGAGTACATSATCGGGTCVLPPACPAGSQCAAPNNVAGTTCATNITCSLPQTVTSGSTVDPFCTFTGTFKPGTEGSLTDTVTVSGFGNTGQASPPAVTATAQATVTVSEAPATAKVIKSLDSGHACAIARYKVEVDNTSGASTDESESLTALNDSAYGDITKVAGNVVGTTCGVANGAGSFLGTTGAGTLPATIAVGGNYTCEFDGEFCAALGTHGTCTSGLEQTDQVTASLSDDNSEGHTVTVTSSTSLTVDACFTATSN